MFLYVLVLMAFHSSRWMPRNQRLKFQIINVAFTSLVVVPQLYVIARPKSSRYCKQPLVNNLSASIALSLIASGQNDASTHFNAIHYVLIRHICDAISANTRSYPPPVGFSVVFTLVETVPQGLWASYHVFGLLSFGHGACSTILTLTAAACVRNSTV
ncbi:uncharacterized protein LOC129186191 [Dunckerocampus dactyliophorus]|uniref:uncharacterized protein LOC129186191 n=1 Tax=Dunckerocampus dactyliophorus TaxID=161453 RepID=UPI002405EA9B|nr:uncharacterized protein LOC129186191 [Dunckerocampus dactyliophorus]